MRKEVESNHLERILMEEVPFRCLLESLKRIIIVHTTRTVKPRSVHVKELKPSGPA